MAFRRLVFLLILSPLLPSFAVTMPSQTPSAAGRWLASGVYTTIVTVGQGTPVGVTINTQYVNQSGFIGTIILRPNLDHDADLKPDENDLDDDNDGVSDIDEVAAGTDPFDASSKPMNLILPANGGYLERFTSQFGADAGAARNLTDGNRFGPAWTSVWFSVNTPSVPQEFVYSFIDDKAASFSRIDFYNFSQDGLNRYSKNFEVWSSPDGGGFTRVLTGTLQARAGLQSFSLVGSAGKAIKIVITNGYDTTFWQLAEIEVYGAVDEVIPSPGLATVSSYSTGTFIRVDYSGASDSGGSGLDRVWLWVRNGPFGQWFNSGLSSTSSAGAIQYTGMTNEGLFYFDLQAQDRAGNLSDPPAGNGDCGTIYEYALPSGNLLLTSKGGKLERFTSQFSTGGGAATNLNDGRTNGASSDWSWFWISANSPAVPQQFVYSFSNKQIATLTHLAVFNYGQVDQNRYSKDLTIWTSNDDTNYTRITDVTLQAREGIQLFDFTDTTTRYLKIVVTSGYNSAFWELAEIEAHGFLGVRPDSDYDGMLDEWELLYFGSLSIATPFSDNDGDELPDYLEFSAGTHPTNNNSFLKLESAGGDSILAGSRIVTRWASESNKTYRIMYSTNLADPFQPLVSGIAATPPVNSYTNNNLPEGLLFFRIELQ